MKKIINKWSKFAVLILAVVAGVLFLVVRTRQPAPAPPPLPNPNGCDNFLSAAQLLVDPPPDLQNTETDMLTKLTEQNREGIQLVRVGLSRKCWVPARFSGESQEKWVGTISSLYQLLGRALFVEGVLAERQGRYSDAADAYLDCIRLGSELPRGGLAMAKVTAWPFDLDGFEGLCRVHKQLGNFKLSEVIEMLQTIYIEREPSSDIAERDSEYFARASGWWRRFRVRWKYYHMILRSEEKQMWQRIFDEHETKLRLLMVDLAIQHHRLESGRLPGRLRDLKPSSISQIPDDPFNPGGFIYRTNTTGYLLYSIGPDGKDDGGAKLVFPSSKGIPQGDILPE